MGGKTRWIINVPSETDIEVHTYLAQRGMKKGALSRFIEDAVKWRLLDLTLTEARTGFSDLSEVDMEALVEGALAGARRN